MLTDRLTLSIRPRRRRPAPAPCPAIDATLARVIAGQVASGLARGSGASPRAALVAIGVMLGQATQDEATHAELELAGRLNVLAGPAVAGDARNRR